ncbi:zinc-dependent peptidase [Sediminicola sp. 1XM1-17]|uniref:zinc-dependent peptidase n=1 Tax=Sediminicola sp. 1XM1-17 TaxID=3127702 RepID=UPI0030771C7C
MSLPEIAGTLTVTYIVCYFLYIFYYALGLYHINPLVKLKRLTAREKQRIAQNFPVYNKFSTLQKQKFELRLLRFRSRKQFVFHGLVPHQEEMVLLICATAIMLTMGVKDYMISSIHRIIIYPSHYFSRINRQSHIGEYNPGLKTLVLSAEHFRAGFESMDDNLNLGFHEFAHAISFNALSKRNREAQIFTLGLKKIQQLHLDNHFLTQMENTAYFREYGMENIHEFFAVAVENYVETPATFQKEFPVLYQIIGRMLNFDYQQPVKRVKRSA